MSAMKDRGRHLEEAGRPEAEETIPFVDRWVLPYVEDSALWPVLIVLLAHIVAFVAPVVLFAVRDHMISAMVASVLLLYGSSMTLRWEIRRRGRPSTLSLLIAIVWVASGVAAWLSDRHGFL